MKSFLFDKYIVAIIFAIIISNNPPIALDAGLSVNLISLYNANDQLTIFTSQNFSSTVYQSDTAWLVNFYASWCSHCQSYANIYRKIAMDIWTWKTVIRVGALNCYGSNNEVACRQQGVRGYPTLLFIPPGTIFDNTSKRVEISASDTNIVQKELIKELEKIHKKYKLWPFFTPINRITLDQLYARVPSTVKIVFVIVEKRDDLTGRQIMLDYSKYREQIAIFRATTDGKLWTKFNISITEVPAVFAIHRNRTAERIETEGNNNSKSENRNFFVRAIRSFIQKRNYFVDFDDHEFEEIILRQNALKNAEIRIKLAEKNTSMDDARDKSTIHRKVNMIDLELALSYMFQEEIPRMQLIQGEPYNALVQWLNVIIKYFPGRPPLMAYFQQLLSKVNQEKDGFSGSQFRQMIDMKQSNIHLPSGHVEYQHCAGSAPQYRSYPCALWLLFHTLTVSQYQKDLQHINVTEVLLAIKNYIKHFFGCRQCSDNFMKETINITQLDTQTKQEAIIYLWKVHNKVNRRLQGQASEDPKHPKVQFPSRYLCATCKVNKTNPNTNEYDLSKTIDFLLDYYSSRNIETSLIANESNRAEYLSTRQRRLATNTDHADVKAQAVQYKAEKLRHIEYENEKLQQEQSKDNKFKHADLTQSFMAIIKHFPLYIFMSCVIILFVARRRLFKVKTKRYTF